MSSSRRCDEFHRSDAMSTYPCRCKYAATRICKSQRRKSLRLTISSDEIVAADRRLHRSTEIQCSDVFHRSDALSSTRRCDEHLRDSADMYPLSREDKRIAAMVRPSLRFSTEKLSET